MASVVECLFRRAGRSTVLLSVVATLTGLLAFSAPADAAGPASVSISPETATTPSGAPATFTLTVSCSTTGGCNDTKVTIPSTTVTGNGATNDFAAWVGNSSCPGVTKSAADGKVTFTYGNIATGTMQCTFPVSPPNYKTFDGTKVTIRPQISGSNFAPHESAPAVLTVTADHNDELIKQAPLTVTSGLPFTFTLRFYCGSRHDHTGDTGLSALTITDPLPANFTYTSHDTPQPLPGTFTYDASAHTLTYSDPTGTTCRTGGPYTSLDNHQNLVVIYVTGRAAANGVAAPTGSKICNTARANFTYVDGIVATSAAPEVCSTVAGRVPPAFLGKPTNAATFPNTGQYRFPPDKNAYNYTFPGDWDASGTSALFQIQLVQTVANAGASFAVQDPLPCLTNFAGQVYSSNPPGAPYCAAPAFIPTLITASGFAPAATNAITLVHPDGSTATVNYTAGKGWVIPTSPPVAEIDIPPFAEEGRNTGTSIFFNLYGYASPLALPNSLLTNTATAQAYEVGSSTPLVPQKTAKGSLLVADPTVPSGTVVRPVIRSSRGPGCSETIGFTTPGAPFYNSIEIAAAPSQAIYVDYLAPAGATGLSATALAFTLEQMHTSGGWRMMFPLSGGQKHVTAKLTPKVTPNFNGTGRTLYEWVIPAGTITRPGVYSIYHPDLTVTLEPGCAGTYQNDLTVGYGAPIVSCLYGDYFPSGALPPKNPAANADLHRNGTPVTNSYCGLSAPLLIAAVNPGFRVDKTVQGNLDAAPVSSGGIGSVSPSGGTATYKVTFTNSGGSNVANPVMYDLLPSIGDTAASSLTPRNSQLAVALTGVGPLPAGVTVSYSTSANPCRPEVLPMNPGCHNDWTTTAPSPLSSVTALKFTYAGVVAVAGAPGTNSFTVPFTVATPAGEPGKVAWNSVGTNAYAGVGGGLVSPAESSVTGLQTIVGPTIVKVATTASFAKAGDTIGYSFTVTNNTAVPLTDVAVLDSLVNAPPGDVAPVASCRSLSAPAGPCSGATTTLQPNQSATFVAAYTATQADVDQGSVSNRATASGTPPTGGMLTNTSNTVLVPAVQTSGISLAKTADPPTLSTAGQTVTYSFTVTNNGNVTLTAVKVDEKAFSGKGTAPVPSCPATTLAPDATMTCTARYTVTQADVDAGSVLNTATATGVPPSGAPLTSLPATENVEIPADPAIRIVKSASPAEAESFSAGQPITYSYVVTNSGNVTLTDVAVDETAFTGSGPAPVPQCPAQAATLPPDAQVTCTATYHLTQADIDSGLISNTAVASGEPPSGPPVIAPASSVTIPQNPRPAVTLLKTAAPSTITAAGQDVTYTFVATNTGNVTLSQLAVKESAFSGKGPAPEVSCPDTTGPVAPGGQVTCTARYTATQADIDAGHITNTATATATPPSGPAVTSPPSSATVTAPGSGLLRLVKSASPSEAAVYTVGQAVTYSYVVTNTGNVTLADVSVNETTFTGTGPAPVAQCPSSTLAPRAQMTCTASYSLTQADIDAGSLTNVATATGEPPTGPKVFAAASAVTIPQSPEPSLTVVKTADPTEVTTAGKKVTYTFVVTNTGNVSLRDVTVTENAFSGTGTAPVPSCPTSSAPMLPGIEMTCTATYTATAADVTAGSVTNAATATGTPPAAPASTSPPSSAIFTAVGNPVGEPAGSVSVLPGSIAQPPAPAPAATLPRTGTVVADLLRFVLALMLCGTALMAAGRRRKGE